MIATGAPAALPYDPDLIFCAWCKCQEHRRGEAWAVCTPSRYEALRPLASHGVCPTCASTLRAQIEVDHPAAAAGHVTP